MGNVLCAPVSSIYVERKNYTICKSVYSCMHGYRFTNEDDHAMIESGSATVFNGIFDGHSGDTCAKFVASKLPQKLLKNDVLTHDQVKAICLETDTEFLNAHDTGGTTATFSIIKKIPESNAPNAPNAPNASNEPFAESGEPSTVSSKFSVMVCNVGDSMTLILDKKNNYEIKFSTIDHKPTVETERNRIIAAGGSVNMSRVDGSLAVSRAFGDKEFKTLDDQMKHKVIACPDINEVACDDGDIVVHFCDGITECNFSPKQVAQFIADNIPKYKDVAIISSLLCQEALKRGSKDNLSCIITILGNHAGESANPEKETLPGEFCVKDPKFIDAYKKMAEMSGDTLENSLGKRINAILNVNDPTYCEREIERVLLKDKLFVVHNELEFAKKIIDDITNKHKEISDVCDETGSSSDELSLQSCSPASPANPYSPHGLGNV